MWFAILLLFIGFVLGFIFGVIFLNLALLDLFSVKW